MAKSNLLECYLQSELHRVMRLSMRLQEPAMFTVCSGVNPVGEANTGLTGPDMALKIVCIQVVTRTDGFHKSILYKIYTSPQQQSVFYSTDL